MTEKKSFGLALLLWFFLGSIGAHRMYAKESAVTLLWYWLAFICTLSIIFWVDLFLLKKWCMNANNNVVHHHHYHN